MKINYEILWFEDQPKELEHDLESVQAFMADAGFTLKVEMRDVVDAASIRDISNRIRRYNKYDLIVFDFDMGKSMDGSNIASILRSDVFTDMVFYSGKAAEHLRKILYEKKIEGVFLVDRIGCGEQLEPILEDYIRKVCDVNSMRGVVMDEVSRFDRLLRHKCKTLLEGGTEEFRTNAKNDICKRIKDRGDQMLKKAGKITCPVEALADHRISDFNLVRQRLLTFLAESNPADALLGDKAPLSIMQNLRNRLAHLEGIYSDDGKMTLADDTSEVFDYDRFRAIRRSLREISTELDALCG